MSGIGAIDSLHLDQRALAAFDPRHGAKACQFRHLAFVVERRALLFARAPVHALEGQIAADEQTALPGESLVERCAERADRGNGGNAKRDADHENDEAAGPGAELA